MKHLTLILYVLLTVVLAVATWVEHTRGTDFVVEHIYHSMPFIVLWGVLGGMMIFSQLRKTFFQVGPKFFLHLSFAMILVGALTTFLTGKKGMMHLRMGEPNFQFVEEGTQRLLHLPFSLELDTFYIDYYPGTDAPADYVSVVKIGGPHPQPSPGGRSSYLHNDEQHISLPSLGRGKGEGLFFSISMNNILTHRGYRFYQSSFDEDERGTWLSVNYDPWGTGITYAGYIMLLVSMVWMMIHPRGGFRRLLKQVDKANKSRYVTILLLLTSATTSVAHEAEQLPIISIEEAEHVKEMQVIYHNRVVPLNTLARDFVRKLYGKDSFHGLSAEQVLLSWQRYPEEWAYAPIIKVKSDELRALFGLDGKYARMVDVEEMEGCSSTDKTMREVEEKVALATMLQSGTLVRYLPEDGSVPSLSRAEVKAELIYNCIPFTKVLFMFNLTMGIAMLLWSLLFTPTRRREAKCFLYLGIHSFPLGKVGMGSALLFALTGYLLRWYIGGRIPLSNGYETMYFMSLCVMGCALLVRRRLPMAIPFGFLLSGFALLVAYLGQMNPQITPLVPVLVSPWLSLHVSVIMMSYALFAFILLNGVWALCVPREAERLMVYSRLMLFPAVFLLAAGIFMGAVWANVSWGRYWGWDPKEVWALITLLIYALPMHGASLPLFRKPKFFHAYLILSFLSVLITYFGVNFFLGGMHSYA
ncbi:MAG: cytochrome c biogenesis protein CcsA [Bacteroidaceae bacterium]|nr:cytochrome c biogenesis protein CcsA [Bacteroidaceae bacterium]